VSRQEFDQLTAGSRSATADIRAGEAAVRIARLNLGYSQVRSPIDGRASSAKITVGNVVGEDSMLTTIAGVGQLHASFDSSEQSFLRMKAGAAGGKPSTVYMGLANEQGYPHRGEIDFVDNRLNPQTGAIRMRASFSNTKALFTPGLAVRLKLESPVAQNAVLVPERAIGTDQTRKLVFVVAADGSPQPREVKPGALIDGMRVLLGGPAGSVKPGENVVVDGLQRIVPGMKVAPQVLQVDAKGMPIPPAAGPAPGPAASAPR
ncbi:MAG: efflux RND transporter periplasmic adaptor subunit, partial [Chitinophagaceae bacterium]|nr:efflux RND transporter periplasmic adaptor subunit [Rubrivivax sp.]